MISPRLGMFNVVQRQIELVIVILRFSAIFDNAIGQDTDDTHTLLSEERQYPVIEQISCCDRCFGGVKLGGPHLE